MTVYHPTARELQAWRLLCRHARRMAADPTGPAGDLRASAKAAARCVAPSEEALKFLCAPLCRLGQAFAVMHTTTRRANVGQLLHLADGLGALVGETRTQRPALAPGARLGLRLPDEEAPTPPASDVLTPRPPRADIHG